MSDRFNPQLRDGQGRNIAAPIRGSAERRDFRGDAAPVDPNAVNTEAQQRAQAGADRRAAAIERDHTRQGELAGNPAADRRLASLEAAVIELKVRVATLESALAATRPAKVSRIPKRSAAGDDGPRAA
jgi:hypothetical protein